MAQVKRSREGADLEVSGELLVEGLEEVLAVDLGVGSADLATVGGRAVGEDGDDQALVGAPTWSR